MTVAELLADGLRQAGVERGFSSSGAHALGPFLDIADRLGLPVVSAGSAWAACVAGAVAGLLANVPGLAVVGALRERDAIAGVRFACQNRAPLIVLTTDIAPDGPGALGGVAKESLLVTRASASHWVAHAARLALTEPRGPVHLGIAGEELEAAALPLAVDRRPPAAPAPESASLEAAAELIRRASRPLVVAGRGCRRDDTSWLRAFMEAMPAPVLTTATARGAVPEPHPLSLGVLDGERPAHPIVERADLIITVGVDRDELPGWVAPRSTVHVDLARCADEPFGVAAARVTGEPGAIFAELASRLTGRSRADWDVAEVDRLKRGATCPAGHARPGVLSDGQAPVPAPVGGPGEQARGSLAPQLRGGMATALEPSRIVHLARELTAAGAIATFDGGQAWSAQRGWQAVELGDCLVAIDRQTRGTAIPSAIAAGLVFPRRQILAFVEVSGLVEVAGELTTLKRLGLPIMVVVFGAGIETDTVGLAQRSGLVARDVADEQSAERALAKALTSALPSVIVVRGAAGGEPRP